MTALVMRDEAIIVITERHERTVWTGCSWPGDWRFIGPEGEMGLFSDGTPLGQGGSELPQCGVREQDPKA